MTGERHGHGMLCVNWPLIFRYLCVNTLLNFDKVTSAEYSYRHPLSMPFLFRTRIEPQLFTRIILME